MTEAEWLACEDWLELIRFVNSTASERKDFLFDCALFRRIASHVPEMVRDIATAEDYLDGELQDPPDDFVSRWSASKHGIRLGIRYFSRKFFREECNPPALSHARDIFGNPFRPVSFHSAWRTDTAVSLARGMYESREFGAMPILADALQDAGCEDEQILNHCRDVNQPHVRGCWVCDLVLGKA